MSRHLRLSLACLSHPSKGSLGGAPGVDNADGTSMFLSDVGFEVQSFLCSLAGSAFPPEASCLPGMAAPTEPRSEVADEEPPANSPWPPSFLQNPYNPGFCNNVAADQASNNCYNYGVNQK